MMRPLRKRHKQVWTLWAFLLPVGILSAWLVIPNPPLQEIPEENIPAAYSTLMKSIEGKSYTVNLRRNETGAYQLEWINHEALIVPTATIYIVPRGSKNIGQGKLLGRIEALGDYRFDLPGWTTGENEKQRPDILLYDFIHESVIETIHF